MLDLQYDPEQPYDREIAKTLAAKLIARPDVYAVQKHDIWMPVTDGKDGPYKKIGMPDLLHHIHGQASYGHYLLNEKGQCKFFAFDIDLEKADAKNDIYFPVPGIGTGSDWQPETFVPGDPREMWRNPKMMKVQREFLTFQLVSMAKKLACEIWEQFQIPVAVSYSGNKGMHVYALTGLIDAGDARDGAQIVLDTLGCFEAVRGNNFFKHKQNEVVDPVGDYPQLSIEIFPKQAKLDDSKKLGNLMRLPTGRNLKGGESFFLDLRERSVEMTYRDPIEALTSPDPWV